MGRSLARKKLLVKMDEEAKEAPAPIADEKEDEDWVILEKAMTNLDNSANAKIPAKISTLTLPDFENGSSGVISKRDLFALWSLLPKDVQMYHIQKRFVASRHGYSLLS